MALGAILFDLDGTLLDTAADFVVCLNLLRARYQLPSMTETVLRPSISDGASAMLEAAFPGTMKTIGREELLAEFLDLYEANLASQSRLFPGIQGTLSQLQQSRIPWGVVTNKPVRFTGPLLQALNLTAACAVLVCPDDVRERKPHPESLLLAARRLGIEPAQIAYVGDHPRDIEAGRRARMTTVAAGWGYIPDPHAIGSWGADYQLLDSQELQPLLTRLCPL